MTIQPDIYRKKIEALSLEMEVEVAWLILSLFLS